MTHQLLDPAEPFPIRLPDGTRYKGTVHLRPLIDHPNVEVGDFTYASDFDPPEDGNWLGRLAPYLFPFSEERLVIGRFCQIAQGVRFITASANHNLAGLSTYPFAEFDPGTPVAAPDRRDTVIGHDVWLGHGAMILPGARIGSGAIVGTGAVVRGEVPAYAVVTGNPGRVARMRFPAGIADALLALGWWDWPLDRIAAASGALVSGDIETLRRLAP